MITGVLGSLIDHSQSCLLKGYGAFILTDVAAKQYVYEMTDEENVNKGRRR